MKHSLARWIPAFLLPALLTAGVTLPANAAAPESNDPFGHLDAVTADFGGLRVKGWAIDPDTVDPVYVWVTVDGRGRHVYAGSERWDIGAAYPESGAEHGFSSFIEAGPGSHRVCATVANVGDGEHVSLGCRGVTVPGGSPFGNFERASRTDTGIEIKGWAIDPDTADPVYLWVTVDGVGRFVLANAERTDVESHFVRYGPDHGFLAQLAVSEYSHRVCVAISNIGSGSHTHLGCRDVAGTPAPDTSPFGNFERLTGGTESVDLKGWAIDPDTSDPIYVWVTVDGVGRHILADAVRPDLERAYPASGANHGFVATVPAEAGIRRVCVTAANVGGGSHKPLDCRQVSVAAVEVAGSSEPGPEPSPTPTPTPTPTSGGMPDASNTGVPAGTSLRVHAGDMYITTPGTVIDGLDIHGTVSVRADDVVIKNSRIRGHEATYNTPLVSMNKGNTNLLIQDTEIAPDTASPYLYGIMGWEFTLQRVNIHNVVDSAHIYGPNVTINSSWLHDNVHFENDPNFGGTPTHDDGIQIQEGNNIRITGSRIEGAYNAAIQITQDRGVTGDVQITGNWLDGGGCTVNIAEKGRGPIQDLISANNTFGRDTRHYDCAMIAPQSTPITATDNYFTDGTYARVRNGG